MPPENDTSLFDQLKARIEEYNQKDRQAVDRAKEERDKWLQTKSDAQEEDISNQ
jgi:ATP-dependent protease HslVU (ClpYQ) peptidase subunit